MGFLFISSRTRGCRKAGLTDTKSNLPVVNVAVAGSLGKPSALTTPLSQSVSQDAPRRSETASTSPQPKTTTSLMGVAQQGSPEQKVVGVVP